MTNERVVILVGARLVRESARIGAMLAERGLRALVAPDQKGALAALLHHRPAAVAVAARMDRRAALEVADVARMRHPDVPVIVLSEGAGFSDGSIFAHMLNVAAALPGAVETADLVELIAFHAGGVRERAGAS